MTHRVIFSPEAEVQLLALYNFIAAAASPNIAAGYTEAIVSYCESLATFPMRGTMRNDVRPGLRVTHYKKRAVIAFSVDSDQVSILGIFYGGQDYESFLQEDPEDGPTHWNEALPARAAGTGTTERRTGSANSSTGK